MRKPSSDFQRSSISARSEDNSFRKKSYSTERSFAATSYSDSRGRSSDYSQGRSFTSDYSSSGDYTRDYSSRDKSNSRSSSPTKIALSALK